MKKKIFIWLIAINHLSNFCSEEEQQSPKRLNSELYSKRQKSENRKKIHFYLKKNNLLDKKSENKKQKQKTPKWQRGEGEDNNSSSLSINKSQEAKQEE